MAEPEKEKQTDLLSRAREAARLELESLRGKPVKPVKQTLLTGYRKREFP